MNLGRNPPQMRLEIKMVKEKINWRKRHKTLLDDWRWFGKKYNILLKRHMKLEKLHLKEFEKLKKDLKKQIEKDRDTFIQIVNELGNKIVKLEKAQKKTNVSGIKDE